MAKVNPILSGEKFTRLTVTGYYKEKKAYWCMCDCGKIIKVRSHALRSGRVKSCGCYIKEMMSQFATKPESIAVKNEVYKNYRQAAKHRNKEFLLTKEEFNNIIIQNCTYCGSKPNMSSKRNQTFKYNGIDRKDNNIGYTLENCVSCCSTCNYAKHELALEQFQNWINNLVDFQLRKSNNKGE